MGIGTVLQAAKFLPATLSRKALEKLNPKFKNYFTSALAYGIDSTRVLDFLSERLESDQRREYKQQLQKGAANNTLRPDELSAKSQIENAELPGKLGRTALGFATGALFGTHGQEQPQQQQPQQEAQPQPANPLSREGLQQDVEAQQAQESPQSQAGSFDMQFPHLIEKAQKMLQQGFTPEQIIGQLSSNQSYKGLLEKFEKLEGKPFIERLYELTGGRGQQGQQQSAAKSQFLEALGQFSEQLKGLRR